MDTPVFTFAAYSGTGKTTYLESLIPYLKEAGLRVAVVKHDAHQLEFDTEGKDTWRFSAAGADVVAAVSGDTLAGFDHRQATLQEALSHIHGVDLILTEGFKTGPWPKIALLRKGSGRSLAVPMEECFAIVSDEPLQAPCPVFPLGDPRPLARALAGIVKGGGKL